MSVSPLQHHRPFLPTVALLSAALVLAACGKTPDAAAPDAGAPAAGQPVAPPTQAVSASVSALNADTLRDKARQAYQESRLYAPVGDNAMEYYIALREKAPGDPGASSALTDLLPMTVIATEQSRDRDDFVEAQRLYGLIEKADPTHPALPRLKASIATAQDALAKRAADEKLTAEQELERKAQLEKDRLAQQQTQQAQAAQQLAAQQAATPPPAAAPAAAPTPVAATPRAPTPSPAAATPAPTPAPSAPTPAPVAAAAASSELRAISTPAPRYPPEALRSATSGEVQVEFTVAADGSVSAARVVRATPPRVFDREAVAAVRRWRFEPVGAPVTTRRTIGFNPGN